MREIKFRAWVKDSKSMIEDVLPIHNEVYRLYCRDFEQDTDRYQNLGSAEIMQYTGLKDKNGKEIYEGDIAKVFQPFNVPTKAIVEFNDGCFELKGIELTWRDYVKCFVVNHAIEIIGNVHENPELFGNS